MRQKSVARKSTAERVMVRAISDIDIYRSAKLLIDQHGDEAPIHAAMRLDELHEAGDVAADIASDRRATAGRAWTGGEGAVRGQSTLARHSFESARRSRSAPK